MKTLKIGCQGEDVKILQRALHLLPDGIFGPITEESVKAHQKKYGLNPDGIVGPLTWDTISRDEIALKAKRTIKEIIVHCTATKEGQSITVEDVRRLHKKKGWSDIGYHFLIYLDGSIHAGRPIDVVGAHTKGHNAYSIGVCYVGGLDKNGRVKDTRNDAQKESLLSLLTQLKARYPNATIHGHNEFANKACPCFKTNEEYKDL